MHTPAICSICQPTFFATIKICKIIQKHFRSRAAPGMNVFVMQIPATDNIVQPIFVHCESKKTNNPKIYNQIYITKNTNCKIKTNTYPKTKIVKLQNSEIQPFRIFNSEIRKINMRKFKIQHRQSNIPKHQQNSEIPNIRNPKFPNPKSLKPKNANLMATATNPVKLLFATDFQIV